MPVDHEYPVSPVILGSKATVKPDTRIVCRRCPNADWVEMFEDGEYGTDVELRCHCSGLGGIWSWPKFSVGACQARTRAIRAERDRHER